jgi:two-component system phosphate regulon sensor histidine kinase PhoR
VAAILRSVVSTLRPLAEDTGAEIALEGAADPVEIPGDADQLAQVFSNLVENAVKYGQGGTRIDVRLSVIEHDPAIRGPAAIASVEDDGDGIDPVHIPRLTERFYRVDDHRSRELGGTGLGLAIVKHIVNRHRGRLRIESRPGEGSRFTVVLPRT